MRNAPTREFIAILGLDEVKMESSAAEAGCAADVAPGEFLKREFGWLEQSGFTLEGWALLDHDVCWEQYLLYLVDWAISNSDHDQVEQMPETYQSWKKNNGYMTEERT